ncbi:RluA family pseudouridine synthase [Prevotella sp. KH2C16]|uniref:RluA family pseudouridine synthase n=1 Tax=Prevotella sp. KH2C16 TaxID=1855325 RepID=UPI0008E81D0B|nr:RluA family pseudouridine synthase [Prevotella sp. KH2C16]SFG64367.1 tRNA pseudouridine32 synthase / 23S rRNA pseudouridine746 synthase [Prevotella sp. KH2C16]
MLFHPLHTDIKAPERFTNPFYYEPHPLCLLAFEKLRAKLEHASFREEIDRGKMFGVLVVEKEGQTGYLQAYSGQILAIDEATERIPEDERKFVPAIFDYLQPDGYFKQEESRISLLNRQIEELETNPCLEEARAHLVELQSEASRKIADYRQYMKNCKERRDLARITGITDETPLLKESQYQKAELRRLKKSLAAEINLQEEKVKQYIREAEEIKRLRKLKSDALQGWLFSQFTMQNAEGNHKNLADIFHDYFPQAYNQTPPSGAGECCEPKLLQYAYAHHMRPLCMAMFWWGASPRQEIRHHLHFYPACQGKCKPILDWMLRGLKVDGNPLEKDQTQSLSILYEDNDIIVVNKPAGMLSIPGKSKRQSVLSLMKEYYGKSIEPMAVHRLDMATSGLLVVAKNRKCYRNLQQQFKEHTVKKRYTALLSPSSDKPTPRKGIIDLPLAADKEDRPRQIVDLEDGKAAITEYEFLDENRIALYPKTGRTHQLRVHCAHQEGLNRPILGDELYGKRADRLYLHAEYLEFTHPATGERIHFEEKADF